MKALVQSKMDTVFETESSNASSPENSVKFWTGPLQDTPEHVEYSENNNDTMDPGTVNFVKPFCKYSVLNMSVQELLTILCPS